MSMLERLQVYKNDYVKNFPKHTLASVSIGFTASTILRAAFDGVVRKGPFNGNQALLAGTMAATAIIIEAVTRPIVRKFIPTETIFRDYGQICGSRIVTLGLAYLISSRTGVNYAPEPDCFSSLGFLTPTGYLISIFLVYSLISVESNRTPINFNEKNITTVQLF